MSLTPTMVYNGDDRCTVCGKHMGLNDQGIVYNKDSVDPDLLFCSPCAVTLVNVLVGDLNRVDYGEFSAACLSRHPSFPERLVEVTSTFNKKVRDVIEITGMEETKG